MRPRRDHIYTALVIVILVIGGMLMSRKSHDMRVATILEFVVLHGSSDMVRQQLCGVHNIYQRVSFDNPIDTLLLSLLL